jgi:hypothetical protein
MSKKHSLPRFAQLVLTQLDLPCAACKRPVGAVACLVKREGVICKKCWRKRAKAKQAEKDDAPVTPPGTCPKCGAAPGQKCKNYKGQNKQDCPGRKPPPRT